jgi:hypothetical protein
MAVNDFPHSIPNETKDKERKDEPDLSYSVPNECGISTHKGTLYIKTCEYTGSVFVDDTVSTTTLTATTGTITNLTSTNASLTGTINVQSWKGFDIKHPNKSNYRLRHICLEGPEAGVYIRGKLVDNNIIKIPDYWNGLIDYESITVTLTQIGHSQDLIVDEIVDGNIYIRSGNNQNINCYYTINASRIDGEKLIIEYEGETPADYPGNSSQFSISGYDYGNSL